MIKWMRDNLDPRIWIAKLWYKIVKHDLPDGE